MQHARSRSTAYRRSEHHLRIWFPTLVGQGGLAVAQFGIWAGHASETGTMRYDTPFFVTSAGTLQMLGSRPLGTW